MKKVILARISTIKVPGLVSDLVTLDLITDNEVSIDGGKVIVSVNVPGNFPGDLTAQTPDRKQAGRAGRDRNPVGGADRRTPGPGHHQPIVQKLIL